MDDDEPLSKLFKKSETEEFIEDCLEINSMSNIKPLTAYAHFFNDTQHSIRSQNPSATFEEISTVVKSMWDSLDLNGQQLYIKKEEDSKKAWDELYGTSLDELLSPERNSSSSLVPSALDEPREAHQESSFLSNLPDVSIPSPTAGTQVELPGITVIAPQNSNFQTNPLPTLNTIQRAVVVSKVAPSQGPLAKVISSDGSGRIVVLNSSSLEANKFSQVTGGGPSSISVSSQRPVTKYFITANGTIVAEPAQGVHGTLLKGYKVISIGKPNAQSISIPSSAIQLQSQQVSAGPHTVMSNKATADLASVTESLNSNEESMATDGGRVQYTRQCLKSFCTNVPVKNDKWNDDFCSPRCVVDHCKEVFCNWVATRSQLNMGT